MVAPVSKTAKMWDTGPGFLPISGDVYELCRRAHATAALASSLYSSVWKVLESKEMSHEEINLFLSSKRSMERYDRAFRVFYQFCTFMLEKENIAAKPEDLHIAQIAGKLLVFNKCSESQARNAYAALVMVPGFDQLRSTSILSTCKKSWNGTREKYGAFWSPEK